MFDSFFYAIIKIVVLKNDFKSVIFEINKEENLSRYYSLVFKSDINCLIFLISNLFANKL